MDAIPIGIVTRNRVAYLDATLRSLSATELPQPQPLVLFDDASDDPATLAYLYGDAPVDVPRHWPTRNQSWRRHGLDVLNRNNPVPQGLAGKVLLHRLASNPLGVVNASCRAVSRLLAMYPAAPGAFLLQDDEIFNFNWRARMLHAAAGCTPGGSLGVLAGCRLNRPLRVQDKRSSVVLVTKSVTAQCLYITRHGYEAARGWFEQQHTRRQGFDDHLCRAMRRGGHAVCMVNPFVCQHIGMVSLVRPRVGWTSRGGSGRVGLAAHPPYVLADTVKDFLACG